MTFDVVIVGGGHNGLVAAAYLARRGLSTLVCERRPVVGGAAVSEQPFGSRYTVTSLSYVVSLLPPALVSELQLARHGYHVYPQGPYFAPRLDGRYLGLPADPAERHAQIAKFSRRDGQPTTVTTARWPRWRRCCSRCSPRCRPGSDPAVPATWSGRPGCCGCSARPTSGWPLT